MAFNGNKRAKREVVNRLGLSEPAAEAYIHRQLAVLEPEGYAYTLELDFEDSTVIADVYGMHNDDGDWYLKFYMENGRIQVPSFHEPEYDMECKNGLKLKGWRR